MEWLSDPNIWIGLLTLTVLEIVLGIDNIIFISILAGKLPLEKQAQARKLGLAGAFVTRLMLLFSLAWIVQATRPLFEVFGHGVSGRDIILIVGGLFLIAKATHEIHSKIEGEPEAASVKGAAHSMAAIVTQIMLIDIVFSLDSVITAVGMVDNIWIMVAANVVALAVMLIAVTPISNFVDKHPTVKILALSFLVLIGTNLVAEGFGQHFPKGYTYAAMAFSVLVELINQRVRPKTPPVVLRGAPGAGTAGAATTAPVTDRV